MVAADAGKTVIDIGMNLNLNQGGARKSCTDRVLGRWRAIAVKGCNMQQNGLGNRLGLIQFGFNTDAVIADGCINIGIRRRQIGQQAAQAETNCADFAIAARVLSDVIDGGLDVFNTLGHVEALNNSKARAHSASL